MKLTDKQKSMLESLVIHCGWPLKDWVVKDKVWARVMDVGGYNGSWHGPCISRLADRGLCERKRYKWSGGRFVNKYRPTQATIDALKAVGSQFGEGYPAALRKMKVKSNG